MYSTNIKILAIDEIFRILFLLLADLISLNYILITLTDKNYYIALLYFAIVFIMKN